MFIPNISFKFDLIAGAHSTFVPYLLVWRLGLWLSAFDQAIDSRIARVLTRMHLILNKLIDIYKYIYIYIYIFCQKTHLPYILGKCHLRRKMYLHHLTSDSDETWPELSKINYVTCSWKLRITSLLVDFLQELTTLFSQCPPQRLWVLFDFQILRSIVDKWHMYKRMLYTVCWIISSVLISNLFHL